MLEHWVLTVSCSSWSRATSPHLDDITWALWRLVYIHIYCCFIYFFHVVVLGYCRHLLSNCGTQLERIIKNVTRASINKVLSSKWVKFEWTIPLGKHLHQQWQSVHRLAIHRMQLNRKNMRLILVFFFFFLFIFFVIYESCAIPTACVNKHVAIWHPHQHL